MERVVYPPNEDPMELHRQRVQRDLEHRDRTAPRASSTVPDVRHFNECARALSEAVAKTVSAEIQKLRAKADTEIQRIEAISLARSREQDRKIAQMETNLTARINRLVERGLADIEEEAKRSARRKSANGSEARQ